MASSALCAVLNMNTLFRSSIVKPKDHDWLTPNQRCPWFNGPACVISDLRIHWKARMGWSLITSHIVSLDDVLRLQAQH